MSECGGAVRVAVAAATYWSDRPYTYRLPAALAERAVPGCRVLLPFGGGNRRTEGIILAREDGVQSARPLKNVESVLDEEPVLSPALLHLALWMRERFFCTVYEAVRAILPAGLWYALESVYTLAPETDREKAYEAAGRSGQEKLVLDTVFLHGGSAPLEDIEAVFGTADPRRALHSLVKKGVLFTDSREKRRVGDKRVTMAELAIPAEEARELSACRHRRAPKQAAVLELLSSLERVSLSELSYFTGASAATVKALVRDGALRFSEEERLRRPRYEAGEPQALPLLNEEQERAFEALSAMTEGEASAALLYGVTGSGKTAVYVRLMDEVLKKGRSAILMVPEISLTPQMLHSFSSYFGDQVAVLHSSLSTGERYDEWKRVRRGEARVVIGTRSAVFAPAENLGLIIMDEEQEHTYKSENSPRYHARDVAKYRCAQAGALLLLGSATPDVVSMYDARQGRCRLLELRERYNRRSLPSVEIVDMRRELRRGNGSAVSEPLRRELQRNIDAGEQSILFLNRRGASSLISCGECGYTFSCPNCSVSLTWHSESRRLRCHYCGHSERLPDCCPECGGKLNFSGVGTQKLEAELSELFPGVPLLRMDADTVSPAGSHEQLLSRFRREKIPILIGTQMVTKGLDFPNVTLVGVISADQALYSGSHRSAERCFSLITQVVGRSGRGEKPGRALIQSFTPDNQVIRQAAAQDYDSFYESEIGLRQLQCAPPFAEILSVTASGLSEADVLRCCRDMRELAAGELREREDLRILGPAPLPVLRVNRRYRYRLSFSGRCDRELRQLVSTILIHFNTAKEYKGVSVYADMDPME